MAQVTKRVRKTIGEGMTGSEVVVGKEEKS